MNLRSNDLLFLLNERLQHEDITFTQRTYNFFTINVFLGAAFVLSTTHNEIAYFAYIVASFGLLLSLFQVAAGWRQLVGITFWRQYLRLVEKKMGINLDHALFDFYERGMVKTPAGKIVLADPHKKPMNKTFPWTVLISLNTLNGVVLPWLVAMFWLSFLLVLLYRANLIWAIVVISVVFFFLLLASWTWIPAMPKGQDNI
ncbi:MAG TPA: hypothetical protein ACFYD3_02240 [Candidatus Hypogeohydataceae bacterium YC41]